MTQVDTVTLKIEDVQRDSRNKELISHIRQSVRRRRSCKRVCLQILSGKALTAWWL